MCAINGIFSISDPISSNDLKSLDKMNSLLSHRGPDDEGSFNSEYCILGHRRLSILDLSSLGHQPFISEDGRYILSYNGEIYNYVELRNQLENIGFKFKTQTDTEVLLKGFEYYGIEILSKLNGMFAFAVYDSKKNLLYLARDRLGIKPLYYYNDNKKFYFSSEIKAIRGLKQLKFTTNKQALFDYFIFNRTDIEDLTFINEIKRLPKGHFAILSNSEFIIKKWWEPRASNNFDSLETLMIDSVRLRMRSDVKVGMCLSGGLDSSIISGILSKYFIEEKKFETFTCSYPNHKSDETNFVNSLNKHHKFTNFKTYPNSNTAYNSLEKFIYHNDEPTANFTFFSQYEVMKLANSRNAKVLLDGQGGDELFAGYQYFHGFYLKGLLHKKRFLKFLAELFFTLSRKQDKSWFSALMFSLAPDKIRKIFLKYKFGDINPNFFDSYYDTSHISTHFFNVKDLNESLVKHLKFKLEHLLRMEDRNSMAFSIESRVPYLDFRIVEYMLSISQKEKIKLGHTKYFQKKNLGKYSIPEILNRKDKVGFGTPGNAWLKEEKWELLFDKSFNHIKLKHPYLFHKNAKIPTDSKMKWKIIEFYIWDTMNWHKPPLNK